MFLADFGVARLADEADRTATSDLAASFGYTAPEVLDGRPVDGRADLYSLGCALFELLTGRTPFQDAPGMAAQAMAHLRQPPPSVTTYAPWLPAAMDTVIATSMAKDPWQRYPSGAALTAAAAAALPQAQDRPSPPPAVARSRRPLLIAGAVAVVVIGAGTTALLTQRGDGSPAGPAVIPTAAPVASADLPGSTGDPARTLASNITDTIPN